MSRPAWVAGPGRRARLGALALLLAGCTPSPPPPTPAPPPPPPSPPTVAATPTIPATAAPATPTATAAVETAGGLADRGQSVFATVCATCHGDRGQGLIGPPLIGPRATFGRFGETARSYAAYIASNMPQNAPGSLAPEQYRAVTVYLLVQNNLVDPGAAFGEDTLDTIRLPR